MVKKTFFMIASMVCLVFLLCSCQVPLEQGDGNATTETETILEPVPDETTNPETSENPAMSEWKTAYLDYLETQKDYHFSYALVYIDDDDIPELYLSGDCEATGDAVCTYKNGSVIEQRLNRIGGGRYIERSGEICNRSGNMGHMYTRVYKLTDDGFALTFNALSVEHIEDLGNDEYNLYYEYQIEDEDVSEDAHNAAVEAAFDFANSQRLNENEVTYDVIRQQILDF